MPPLLRVALAVPTLNNDAGSDAAGLEAWMPHMPMPKGEVGTTTSDAAMTIKRSGGRRSAGDRLGRRRSTATIVGLFSVDRMR